MTERKDFPTIYHGVPQDDQDTRLIDTALQVMSETLNSLPPHLGLRFICSFVLTACCAQDDPAAILRAINRNVGPEIEAAIAEPKAPMQ